MGLRFRRYGWILGLWSMATMAGCGTSANLGPMRVPAGVNPSDPPNVPVEVSSPTPAPSATPAWHPFSPTPTPVPSPTPTPAMGHVYGQQGTYDTDFSTDAVGTEPPEFINVMDDGYNYSWLYAGNWSVIATDSSHVYAIDDIRPQPALSFRRYRGTDFGTPDGQLPLHYQVSVVEQPIAADPSEYPPTGDQGVQVFYLDPTHYVEVLFKPHDLQVWECNGGVPNGYGGWNQLFEQQTDTTAGQIRTMGADVDCNTGTLVFYVDGQQLATVHSALITPRTHWFALRATGNEVYFRHITIRSE